jgi:hypothetical protein
MTVINTTVRVSIRAMQNILSRTDNGRLLSPIAQVGLFEAITRLETVELETRI